MMWGISWAMLIVCATVVTVGAIELVRDGKPKATIVAPTEGPPSYAAEVLQRYIERMSGARLSIVSDGQKVKGAKVVIRVRRGAAKLDGFRLKSTKGRGHYRGFNPPRMRFTVHMLYWKSWACRFYGPEPLGVVIPKKKNLSVPRRA